MHVKEFFIGLIKETVKFVVCLSLCLAPFWFIYRIYKHAEDRTYRNSVEVECTLVSREYKKVAGFATSPYATVFDCGSYGYHAFNDAEMYSLAKEKLTFLINSDSGYPKAIGIKK